MPTYTNRLGLPLPLGTEFHNLENYKSLINTIDAKASSKAEFDSKVAYLDSVKAEKTYVDSMLSSIAQGGPRGLFYSLAALKTKYPSGTDGTYLVFDSAITDGAHSYMWDAANNTWKDLGIYQGVKIGEKVVGTENISDNAIDKTLISDDVFQNDYFHVDNIFLNNTNSLNLILCAESNSATKITFKSNIESNFSSGKLDELRLSVYDSDTSGYSVKNDDVLITNTILTIQPNENKVEFTLNFQSVKKYVKLMIVLATSENLSTNTNYVHFANVELLINDNATKSDIGKWADGGTSKTATINYSLTGKKSLASKNDLALLESNMQDLINEYKTVIAVQNVAEFVEAIEYAGSNATAQNWVEIKLAEGTYDLIDYVRTDLTAVSASQNRGIELPRYTKIKGAEGLKTSIILRLPDTATTESKWTVSPLNMKADAIVENLVIIGKNTRYVIHDDVASSPFYRLVKDCIIIHEGFTSNPFANQAAYGCGTYRLGCKIVLDNNIFISNSGTGLYMHDNPNATVGSEIVIRNNSFEAQNKDYDLRFQSVGSPAAKAEVKLLQNIVKTGVKVENTDASGVIDDTQVMSFEFLDSGNRLSSKIIA